MPALSRFLCLPPLPSSLHRAKGKDARLQCAPHSTTNITKFTRTHIFPQTISEFCSKLNYYTFPASLLCWQLLSLSSLYYIVERRRTIRRPSLQTFNFFGVSLTRRPPSFPSPDISSMQRPLFLRLTPMGIARRPRDWRGLWSLFLAIC